ncbi:MAG: FhaA domain-containing protein [Pyrinomonadaceae bacterium]
MSVLDKVRRWIDGESAELVLEEAARDAQIKPRSQAEEFIVKIARAVEEVMQREIVPLPQGTTIIPTEYTIFLSDEDDKEWQGVKRKGLEQGLYHILAERAKEISGKKKLETQSFAVELRVDGTLGKGDVRVQHSWEDSSSNKTGILARPKAMPKPQTQSQPQNNPLPPTPNFVQTQQSAAYQPPPTVQQTNVSPTQNDSSEELTHVQKRQMPELYRLEVWRGGIRQNVVPVYQNEISIGRGSKSKPVDIALTGDPEISRRHLSLQYDGNGNFALINEGRNPAMINNHELAIGQRISVSPGVPIAVCSYLLRIQPK